MSRHKIPSKQEAHIVAIGWDNPIMTYFAQVVRAQTASDPRDPVVLWLGTTPCEYTQPETMAESLRPYLDLTPEILATLASDRRADLDRGPTPLQRVSADLLFPQPETNPKHQETSMSDNPLSSEMQSPQPSANSLNQAAPTDDPIKKLVAEMNKVVEMLGPEQRGLKETIGRLVTLMQEPEHLQQPGFRTGVAYALQDLQKVSTATFKMDTTLALEMRDRAVTSPGLNNRRMEILMEATPDLTNRELVRDIRRAAAAIASESGDQDTPQIRGKIEVLENDVRLATSPSVPGQGTRGITTERAQPVAPRPPQNNAPNSEDRRAADGDAPQPSSRAWQSGPIPPQQSQGVVGDIMRSVRMPIPSGLDYRPAPPATAVGDRISMFEQRLAQGKTDRLIQNAERSGVRAIEAIEQFITGPGRDILGKMEAAASTESGGMQTVMKEMQPGGRYANLRTEFDSAYQQDKIFAGAYDKMVESAAQFGKERLAVNDNFAARNLDASQLDGRFQRAEEALGEAAEKIPGRTPGKSALDEMAEKVAELLHKAADKVKSFFGRDVNADATQQVRPSLSMSM